MIKTTMNELLAANKVFNKLTLDTYPGRVAFAIARIVREINKEVEVFEKTRLEIIQKYADKDANGELILQEGNIHISDDKLIACNDELTAIAATEINVNAEPIKIEWLENVSLTLSEALGLEPFLEKE